MRTPLQLAYCVQQGMKVLQVKKDRIAAKAAICCTRRAFGRLYRRHRKHLELRRRFLSPLGRQCRADDLNLTAYIRPEMLGSLEVGACFLPEAPIRL